MIQYFEEGIKQPHFPKMKINSWIKEIASLYDKRTGDIAYIFCSDAKILEVNVQYLQHDYYTDIITFDYSHDKTISGDIFISIETVSSNAEELKIDFQDELYRVMIHGILHLCGQDDKDPKSKIEMTMKENLALDILKSEL